MSLCDQEIANQATAVAQCMTLGAVILTPKPTIGFTQPTPEQLEDERHKPYSRG